MDTLPWDSFGIGSGWALVCLGVWLIFTGRLIPRSEHLRALDHAEHEGNEWRTESRIKDAQLAEKDVQLGHMKEGFTTLGAVMGSIQRMYASRKGDV